MKTVFITGANRGLGLGFVEYLLGQGMLVFAGARNISKFDPKLKENSNFRAVSMNISEDSSIEKAAIEISKEITQLDFLINNAGVNKDTATNNHRELADNLFSLNRQVLLKMFDINSVSPMLMIQKFLPLLISNPSFIINISSDRASYQPEFPVNSGNYGYRASKTALNMFTFCSLHDLPKNIKIFAVHPGETKTDMNPNGKNLPIDQAKKIIEITKNWKEEFNGKFLRFDGNLYPL
ncbi:SDR family NAD(P)-dependent oxidoreductase [Candidatus Gottesmanbacteria bacterium]|nr:SDR family NAD(P)-dependent oxidoreductase [Candidatus Gottesmanbacteria bacterium]